MDREQALLSYQQAWANHTPEEIQAALAQCLAESSIYQNPITDVVQGVQGLTSLILDLPVMFPGATVRYAEAPDLHHDVACFSWQLSSTAHIRTMGRDYGRALDGIDLVEFNEQNRIQRVTAFFGFHRQPRGRARTGIPLDLDHGVTDHPSMLDLQFQHRMHESVS